MSEMWGGICFILHADLRFGITLEIVMLGFQALHRNLSHRHPSLLCVCLQRKICQKLLQDLSEAGQRSRLSLECYATNFPFQFNFQRQKREIFQLVK